MALPHSDALYRSFPRKSGAFGPAQAPNTAPIDRIFASAVDRRLRGRQGLFMHSRCPNKDRENGIAAAPYSVFQGLDDVIPDFTRWLSSRTEAEVHGHLFARDKVHFADGSAVHKGGLSDRARLRDYNGKMFLTNLIWNGRDKHQCFQFGPADTQDVRWMMAKDTQARIWVVSGAWAIPLFLSGRTASEVRQEAARLQRIEHKFLKVMRSPEARARIQIMTLAEFVEGPVDVLQGIIDEIAGHKGSEVRNLPKMADLTGLAGFLQDLKNQGMHPFLTGEFSDTHAALGQMPASRPYVVRQK